MNSKQKELVQKIIQQIKIVDIAEEYGLHVIKKDRKVAQLVEHDSVFIYQNTNSFYRWSTGKGGNIFNFMQEMPEIQLSFRETLKILAPRIDPTLEIQTMSIEEKKAIQTKYDKQDRTRKLLSQVSFDKEERNVIAYLIKERKIEPSIVYEFIDKEILKQETNCFGDKSAVFLGRDDQGMVSNICKRACSPHSKFKQECSGSDSGYGWLYDPEVDSRQIAYKDVAYDPSKTLICFESEIEKMSFLSLLKKEGKNIQQYAYLSTGSAAKYKTIINVVKRIGYKNVIVAYNNDVRTKEEQEKGKINTGQFFAEKVIKELETLDIKATSIYPKEENDWNDMLKNRVERNIGSIKEYKKAAQTIYENKHKNINKATKTVEHVR